MAQVAVRRFAGEGVDHLTVSSTAVGNRDRSLAKQAVLIRIARPARGAPPATALRVVSEPALNSREKNMYSSPSVSCGGSASSRVACTTMDSMSSSGFRRFSAMSSVP